MSEPEIEVPCDFATVLRYVKETDPAENWFAGDARRAALASLEALRFRVENLGTLLREALACDEVGLRHRVARIAAIMGEMTTPPGDDNGS